MARTPQAKTESLKRYLSGWSGTVVWSAIRPRLAPNPLLLRIGLCGLQDDFDVGRVVARQNGVDLVARKTQLIVHDDSRADHIGMLRIDLRGLELQLERHRYLTVAQGDFFLCDRF